MKNNRLIVCAYHNVGYRCVEELLRQGTEICLIFTHEDSSAEEIWFESVRELAGRHGIPWLTTDFIFSFYYRNMIKPEVLEIPRLGALNLHGSCLPKYRGRVPVNWAVINGETETGASLHYMVEKPDAGDIVDQEKVPIAFTDTAFDVFQKVTGAAVTVMARAWPLLRDGDAARTPMNLAEGSYHGGRKPADGRIDWTKSADQIYNLVRGVTHPYPGAFTFLDGRKTIIWKARPRKGSGEPGRIVSQSPLLVGTGKGLLELLSLQIEGGAEQAPELLVQQLDGIISEFV